MGAQLTSSIGRTVSPSVASKKVAPLAFSLHSASWQDDQAYWRINHYCSFQYIYVYTHMFPFAIPA